MDHMPVAYPANLRLPLRASKSRSQPASFRMAEPRRGYGYAQATGTDTPVFWDVQFRFTRVEAVRFQLWFLGALDGGVSEFTMPIRTEFGPQIHTCRFLPDALLDTREEGETFIYGATIMARTQVLPEGFVEAAELILAMPDWEGWAELLDQTVTEALPE